MKAYTMTGDYKEASADEATAIRLGQDFRGANIVGIVASSH